MFTVCLQLKTNKQKTSTTFTLRLVLVDMLQKGFKFITRSEVQTDVPLFMKVPRQVVSGPFAALVETNAIVEVKHTQPKHASRK